jgi:regulatory factor X, other
MDAQMTDASGSLPVTSASAVQPHMQPTYYQQVPVQSYHTSSMDYSYSVPQGHHSAPPQPIYAEQQRVPLLDAEPKKSRSSTGQANENELKDMLERNMHRSLDEVAGDVVANERTSSAEKSKQLFAMLW